MTKFSPNSLNAGSGNIRTFLIDGLNYNASAIESFVLLQAFSISNAVPSSFNLDALNYPYLILISVVAFFEDNVSGETKIVVHDHNEQIRFVLTTNNTQLTEGYNFPSLILNKFDLLSIEADIPINKLEILCQPVWLLETIGISR